MHALTKFNHLKMKNCLISRHYFIVLPGCLQYNTSAEEQKKHIDSICICRFLAMNAILHLQIPLCRRFLITWNKVIFLWWKLNTNLIRCHDQNNFYIKVKNKPKSLQTRVFFDVDRAPKNKEKNYFSGGFILLVCFHAKETILNRS